MKTEVYDYEVLSDCLADLLSNAVESAAENKERLRAWEFDKGFKILRECTIFGGRELHFRIDTPKGVMTIKVNVSKPKMESY